MSFFYIVFFLFLFSCASIHYPEGGPKDGEPPVITFISPNLPKTQFNQKKIEIKFNEYLKNEDYTKEILFSPLLKSPPKVLTYAKKIKVILPHDLENDCTYLLTIGKNIKDFHEGNTLQVMQQFPFTKSSQFDTCAIRGELLKTHPKMKLDNYLVFLYHYDSVPDNNFLNKTPIYFGLIDNNQFKIEYVKSGKYKILALQDKNNDYKWNDNENVGIDEDLTVDFTKNTKIEMDLFCFPYDIKPPKISKASWKDSLTFVIDFNEPIINDSLKILLSTNYKAISSDKKAEICFANFVKDSISIQLINLLDTLGNKTDTTFTIVLNKTNSSPKKFQLHQPEIFPDYWLIKANACLDEKEIHKIQILDTLNHIMHLPIKIQNNYIKIHVNEKLDTAQIYTIQIDSTFLSFQSSKLDSTVQFKVKPINKENYYCYLKIDVDCDYESFLGVLKNITTQEKIIFTNKIAEFGELKPGKYQIIIINDLDNNGLWSTGDLKNLKLPEDIYIFPQELELKPKMKIENLKINVD